MHVPMVIAGPGVPSGKRIPAARTVDLVPTILTLLGKPVPDGLDGQPLVQPAR
jgi:arylsulfatase A-like enzyme